MIIQDLLTSNANQFISELKMKHANLTQALVGTKPGGDFRETIAAQIAIVQAALNAANNEYHKYIAPPKPDQESTCHTCGGNCGQC